MKKFNVNVVETLSRIIEVEAGSLEEAKDIVMDMYDNEEVVLDAGDYDNNVEFYPTYINPIDVDYIMSAGWERDRAEYIYETLIALKNAGVEYSDEELFEIIDDSDTQEFVGIYDESFFRQFLYEITGYEFEDLQPGTYDSENGFYKTKDGEYVMDIHL